MKDAHFKYVFYYVCPTCKQNVKYLARKERHRQPLFCSVDCRVRHRDGRIGLVLKMQPKKNNKQITFFE